jgi:nucleotide-binding universal stress UspA family protein
MVFAYLCLIRCPQVCHLAASDPAVKLVVLLNYSRRGLIQEALHGSVASHLSRHCPKPLLLLQLPE